MLYLVGRVFFLAGELQRHAATLVGTPCGPRISASSRLTSPNADRAYDKLGLKPDRHFPAELVEGA